MEVLKVFFSIVFSGAVYLWKFVAYLFVGLVWIWRQSWILRWGVFLGGLWVFSLPYQGKILERVPYLPVYVLWTMVASGVFCMGIASILYVLFRFLGIVAQLESRSFSGSSGSSSFYAPPTVEAAPKTILDRDEPDQGSSFTGYSDEVAANLEQLRKLRDRKLVNNEDYEELLKSSGVGAQE